MDAVWGDYTWNDVIDRVAYGAWTDHREGADEDVWAAKICSEPSHWSERAPTFTAPPTTATPAGGNTFTTGWTVPDLYWGDGGESPSQREVQLWVDGGLESDNLPATSTATTWTAPDTASHTVRIRAVNQCGFRRPAGASTSGSAKCPLVIENIDGKPTIVWRGEIPTVHVPRRLDLDPPEDLPTTPTPAVIGTPRGIGTGTTAQAERLPALRGELRLHVRYFASFRPSAVRSVSQSTDFLRIH